MRGGCSGDLAAQQHAVALLVSGLDASSDVRNPRSHLPHTTPCEKKRSCEGARYSVEAKVEQFHLCQKIERVNHSGCYSTTRFLGGGAGPSTYQESKSIFIFKPMYDNSKMHEGP